MDEGTEKIITPETLSGYLGDPLPQRDPMKSLADWPALEIRSANIQTPSDSESGPQLSPSYWSLFVWSVLATMMGSVLLCVAGATLLGMIAG